MTNNPIAEALARRCWAVVGASDDPSRFGHKIWHALRNHGYRVYPVNPKLDTVAGEKCYASVLDLPETPDVVDMVVNPKVGLEVMKDLAKLGVKTAWMQPGTRSDEIRDYATENGVELIEDCVLVQLGE